MAAAAGCRGKSQSINMSGLPLVLLREKLYTSETFLPPAAGQPALLPSTHSSWRSPGALHPAGTHPG